LTDEVSRRRKLYSDFLGREWKTEILNWDASVYSTSVSVFNVRDQITRIKQYAGNAPLETSSTNEAASCPSGTCQETSMIFDGYARLYSKHRPEQNPGTTSTYAYNMDDTLISSTDARGAVTSYTYNGRHLVTSVTSTLAGSSPINVTYIYDAAGNGTSMLQKIDGVTKDSAKYNYDELSRMTSESVTINGLQNYAPNNGNYTIGYEYTLSNQLKKVTDPFNSPTEITYDELGRTKTVTGTWNGTNYTYANNVLYRAWGAVKSFSLGATTSYDSRMRPTHYSAYDYTYYDDGKLKGFRDAQDQVGNPNNVQFHYMSRGYSYDQAGRVSSVGQLANYTIMPPFSCTYGYDAFGNLTSRSGSYALNPSQSDSGSYTNNRRAGWTYNPEGMITNSSDNSDSGGSSTRTWTYDAAGRFTFTSEVRNGQTTTLATGYDGNGKVNHEIINNATGDYLIHSSVLGTVLTKLKVNGAKDITYVPTNGLVAPMQMQDQPGSNPASYLTPVSRDPLGIQEDNMYAIDPFGTLVANAQPPVGGPPSYIPMYGATYSGVTWSSFINANNFSGGCYSAQNNNPTICSGALEEQMATMGGGFWANLPGAAADPYSQVRYEYNMNDSIYGPSDEQSGSDPDSGDVYYGDIYTSNVTIYAGAAFVQTKQNPILPIPVDLLGKVTAIVTKRECADYIHELLSATAAIGGEAFSYDALDLYNRVQSEGGFKLKRLKADHAGEADIRRGKRVVYLQPRTIDKDPRVVEHTNNGYAVTVVNELMHHARKKGVYDDRTLARAAFSLLTREEQIDNPLPKSHDVEANSKYFHPFVNLHCRSLTGE
jgi:YD repeat-containing protein